MDPARAAALHVALGLEGDAPRAGDALPPFFHQVYFWQVLPPADLGRDGHAAAGKVLPDLGLPRRMWAGGRLWFRAALTLGAPARKTTTIEKVEHKTGRTGPLAFLTLRHDFEQGGDVVITEHQDLVFRQDPDPNAPPATPAPAPTPAPQNAAFRQTAHFDTTLLFRYSALTMNGHRIHYDEAYATQVEGYSGLVVHGPLLAQRLMLLAHARLGALSRFEFRATSAVSHGESVEFCADGDKFWAAGQDGRLCMTAQASAG